MLKERILEISKQEGLSHLGSCLSAVDAIEAVYQIKGPEDRFILSNGHAGLAQYVVLEQYFSRRFGAPVDAVELLHKHGIHPNRDERKGIYVSTGSLGQGLPIALGMALARKDRNIYCMISDGECSEGSIWEALRVGAELNVTNLKVIANLNGYAAYKEVDRHDLLFKFDAFGWQVDCVDGHNIEEMKEVLKINTPIPHLVAAFTTVRHHPELEGIDAHYKVLK